MGRQSPGPHLFPESASEGQDWKRERSFETGCVWQLWSAAVRRKRRRGQGDTALDQLFPFCPFYFTWHQAYGMVFAYLVCVFSLQLVPEAPQSSGCFYIQLRGKVKLHTFDFSSSRSVKQLDACRTVVLKSLREASA